MGKVKAYELRSSNKAAMLKKLDDLRKELGELRVAKVTGGAQSKLAKIKVVRKSIATVLTVYNQKMKKTLAESVSGQRFAPTDLRKKQTRAIRRRLTPGQAAKETNKAMIARTNFPQRRYAVKA